MIAIQEQLPASVEARKAIMQVLEKEEAMLKELEAKEAKHTHVMELKLQELDEVLHDEVGSC